MVEWLAGNRIRGTSTERTSTTGFNQVTGAAGGWKELAKTTLSSASDTLDAGTISAKKYLWVQTYIKAVSGTAEPDMRFNNDSGSNYADRYSINGGTDGTGTSITSARGSGVPVSAFINDFIINNASHEKLVIRHVTYVSTAGAGTAPNRRETVAKWSNTSDSITSIKWVENSGGAGQFDTGSEIVVLGWDPADTHTTNFWEELYSNQLSSNNQEFSTGTISAKKYLWLQFYQQGHTGNSFLRFNADSGSNYSRRHEINGASDANVTSQSQLTNVLTGATGDSQSFTNMFIVNDSSKEKLCIFSTVFNAGGTTGAGNAPQKINGVCKWSNTSDSITSVQVTDNGGAGFDTGSIFKIWGSD